MGRSSLPALLHPRVPLPPRFAAGFAAVQAARMVLLQLNWPADRPAREACLGGGKNA